MRKALSICLVLAVALAGSAFAKPVDKAGTLDKFMFLDLENQGTDLKGAVSNGLFGVAAPGDTTVFGGTYWAADSLRWEAIADSCWTFDSGVGSHYNFGAEGVNPFKNTTLHAYMEGWVGFDVSYGGVNPYFRHLDSADPDWDDPATAAVDPVPCVGTANGLGGSWSWWAGVFPGEALALCYASGQGYGNAWNVTIERSFTYDGDGGVAVQYDYAVETESGFDYAYFESDTSGNGDVVNVHTYTGGVSGTAAVTLTEGVDMRSDAGTYILQFRAYSDGAYSDEDGLDPSTCGNVAVDNVSVNDGTTAYSSDFETDDGGWGVQTAPAGAGGEWSNIVDLTALPAPLTPCTCDLTDTVLVFEDIVEAGHGIFQDNLAASPWIDLGAAGKTGSPGKFIQTNIYAELPLLNYIFVQFNVQWYPQVCPQNGQLQVSPFTSNGFVYYFGGVPQCTVPGGNPTRIGFSDIMDPGADQVRIAVGVISYCRFFPNCTNVSNSTPWFDCVGLGVFGDPNAPFLNASGVDLPQDSFPQSGNLRLDAPGRVSCNNVKGDSQPEVGTALGDTLIVAGGLPGAGANSGTEVYIEFAVDFGPGAPAGANAWLTSHTFTGAHNGQDWYSVRIDTSEQAGSVVTGTWMSAYHESETNFSGSDGDLDANDPFLNGGAFRLENDIFPEGDAGLFTMGTRINMFYKTRYIDGNGAVTTGAWFTFPDTGAGGGANYLEMEVLPSSATADSTWNCVLYVDHFNRGAQVPIETGLGNVISGGSGNFENTPWDRWDVRAESSQQGSFGRPGNTQYNATLDQTYAYKAIVWNSGNLSAFNLVEEDANVLQPWLILVDTGLGDNRFYGSGDGLARSMTGEAVQEPSALAMLNDQCGVLYACDSIRDNGCPTGSLVDLAACMQIDPDGGAAFTGNDGPNTVYIEGNGCPQRRSFDLLTATGTGVGNENYDSTVKGLVSFHSISNDVSGGANDPAYRTVIDGGSVHYRRDASGGTCGTDTQSKVTDRLDRVLDWFGYGTSQIDCSDPTAGTGIGDDIVRGSSFRTALSNFAPNPLVGVAKGRIQFTMNRTAKATIKVFDVNGRLVRTLFDGIATEGENEVFWNGTDNHGSGVASGVYFYELATGEQRLAKKMVVVQNGNGS